MRNGRFAILIVAGMLATGYWLLSPGQAQQVAGNPGVLGVVDVQQVFKDCKEIQALNDKFKKSLDELKAEADRRQGDLKKTEEALSGFKVGSPDYKKRQEELLNNTILFKAWMETHRTSLANEHRALLEDFYQRMCQAVADIANRERLDLVLYNEDIQTKDARSAEDLFDLIRQRKVLFRSARAELTGSVITKMDAAFAAGVPAPK